MVGGVDLYDPKFTSFLLERAAFTIEELQKELVAQKDHIAILEHERVSPLLDDEDAFDY